MTLEQTLLRKVPEWRPAPHARETLSVAVPEAGWLVRLTAERCEALGIALWDMTLERLEPSALDARRLQSIAQAATQVRGLLEPLALIEVDAVRAEAQIRSATPLQRDGAAIYYEIIMSAKGRITLRRYETKDGASAREQVPFVLTHESLAMVASSLAEAVEKAPL
jgi:hypothetical protein